MPKPRSEKPIYQRGPYRLEWDRAPDGSLRSPFLAIKWYDQRSGRGRSSSTGTADSIEGKTALDRFYLTHQQGAAICPTCGQQRQGIGNMLVSQAVNDYLVQVANERGSSGAISARLMHVLRYIATLSDSAVRCDQVDKVWIEGFRKWAALQPIVSPKTGEHRQRALSTIENSVLQLAAAINHMHSRGDTLKPAQFKPIPVKELNRTPQLRVNIATLAKMFAYAADPVWTRRRQLLRFLQISVATMARPDAGHDFSVEPERSQWNSNARVISLNPRGRRQTKKYRAIVPAPRQMALLLDAAVKADEKFYVSVGSVKSAFETMVIDLGLPRDGESGMKLIRRSMAKLVRDRLPVAEHDEIEMWLGHKKFDAVSDIYAPFDPAYLSAARKAIEDIIDEVTALVPSAFRRTDAGDGESIISIRSASNA